VLVGATTFTMRFPLDLVWLAKDGSVVRVDENVPPRGVRTCVRARLGRRVQRRDRRGPSVAAGL
jgi:uncharacterized membrane protein (UPF0127 family)